MRATGGFLPTLVLVVVVVILPTLVLVLILALIFQTYDAVIVRPISSIGSALSPLLVAVPPVLPSP